MASDHPGLLIIRAWIEKGFFRAAFELRSVSAPTSPTRPEEVCPLVKEWLADILRDAEGDPTDFPSERMPGWMIVGRPGGGEASFAAGTPAPSDTTPGPNLHHCLCDCAHQRRCLSAPATWTRPSRERSECRSDA